VKWFGTNTDIQEQLDIREALLLSEQRFRALYHSAAVSISLEDWTLVMGRLYSLRKWHRQLRTVSKSIPASFRKC
jgi:hypothetical protein